MAHFITGSTGFVGSSIILELLSQSDDPIFCLVRRKEGKPGHDRLLELLEQLVMDYGYDTNILTQARKQCIVVEGDLTDTLDGVSNKVTTKVTHFWNVAASLKYEEEFKTLGDKIKDFLKAVGRVQSLIKAEDISLDQLLEKSEKDKHERVRVFYELAIPLIKRYNE